MCDKSLGGLDYEKVAVLRITTYMNCSKSKMFMLALASFVSGCTQARNAGGHPGLLDDGGVQHFAHTAELLLGHD